MGMSLLQHPSTTGKLCAQPAPVLLLHKSNLAASRVLGHIHSRYSSKQALVRLALTARMVSICMLPSSVLEMSQKVVVIMTTFQVVQC